MSLSCRIIKRSDVTDDTVKLLPLRRWGNEAESEPAPEETDEIKEEPLESAEELLAEARAMAEEIINGARAEAERILGQAKAQCEKMREETYKEAFDAGSRDGYREGMARAEREAQTIRAQASGVLTQAEALRMETIKSLESEIIDLARDIAEKLLAAHLSLEPEAVLHVAGESISLVADRLNVVLYVNPLEKDLVNNKKEVLLRLLPPKAEIRVIADESISRGGCRVDTERGSVDATMESRRELLMEALYGDRG
ncbi:MAG: flagellar biosynthesis protein [Firmicutes bacterium]|nr:flagellar biosynthesis protein [Bacillota bacterium]